MTPKQKRTEIKRILHLLEPGNRKLFNRMYHHENIDEDTDVVVDKMPDEKLTWALKQCQNSYYRIFKILMK